MAEAPERSGAMAERTMLGNVHDSVMTERLSQAARRRAAMSVVNPSYVA
jgi:hypothetical protein